MSRYLLSAVSTTILVVVWGCGGAVSNPPPHRAGLYADIESFEAPEGPLEKKENAAEGTSLLPTGEVSLTHAVAAALMFNPELQAHSWEIRALEAAAVQAGLLPNPEFEVEVEEFGGTGELNGFGGSVAVFMLGQEIPLGGAPGKARTAARTEAKLGRWDYEQKRLEVITATVNAFVAAVLAKQQLVLTEESATLVKQLEDTVKARVQSGKASPTELQRAHLLVSQHSIELDDAQREYQLSLINLAQNWGSDRVTFDSLAGELKPGFVVPPLASLQPLIEKSPAIARLVDELRLAEQELAVERAGAVPDLGIAIGLQRFAESDDITAIASVGIPLPLFDRNQGAIEASEHLVSKARAEQRATVTAFMVDLRVAYFSLQGAAKASRTIDHEVLPASQKAFESVALAYRMGKVGLMDLLDAQQTFLEIRAQQVSTRAAFYSALADVEGLLGSPISRHRQETK